MRDKNKAHYKWNKLFASKRFNSNNGVITLTAFEQQELLDDIAGYKDPLSDPNENREFWCADWEEICEKQCTSCKQFQNILWRK